MAGSKGSDRRRRLTWAAWAVIGIAGLRGAASAAGAALSGDVNAALAFELLLAAIQLAGAAAVLALIHRRARAGSVQAVALAMGGFGFIAWAGAIMIGSAGLVVTAVSLVQALILPGAVYLLARGGRSDEFWSGIKQAPEPAVRHHRTGALAEVVQRYALDDRGMLVAAGEDEEPAVEFLSLDEFDAVRGKDAGSHLMARNARHIHHCTANTFGSSIFGTIHVPRALIKITHLPFSKPIGFAFQLTGERLTIVSDDPSAQKLMAFYTLDQMIEKKVPAAVLFELLEFLIIDNGGYLFDLSDRLGRLEENMGASVNEVPRDFDAYVSATRTRLHALIGFYRQLSDLADAIASTPSESLSRQSRELFTALSDRSDRLATDAQDMFDYALQIRDMYETKINLRQNKVMTLLTIVTTIFMPLTLITGWYGMNFDVMPELHYRYAYYVVTAVTASIVTIEVIVFKRKKWF